MRNWMLALAAALAGCAGKTEAGPIGAPVQMGQYLPDSLRAGATGPTDSTFRQEIRIGPDSARVEMVWTTFRHTTGRYLASVSARLVAAARYDSLQLGDITSLRNSGTKEQPVEYANTQVRWFKRRLFGRKAGILNFGFDAHGSRTIGPAEP